MFCDELDLLIGEMFIFGFAGQKVNRELKEWYQQCPAGGLILMGRNLKNVHQVQQLTRELREMAGEVRPEKELLLAVDQEGGSLSPLRGMVTGLPGNMGLAATGRPDAAYWAGYTTGSELRELGFNLDFAPVVDLILDDNLVVGTRSFGSNPEIVAKFGREFAEGLSDAGVLSSLKHFPGHGSCKEDSHLSLPKCYKKLEELSKEDLAPFTALLSTRGVSIMMAHVIYQAFDEEAPASLSPKVNHFLREALEFQGVIITDCLEMQAIQAAVNHHTEAVVRAIIAGNDQVLICHTPQVQKDSIAAVKKAVRERRISLEQLEASSKRIKLWKESVSRKSSIKIKSSAWSAESLAAETVTYLSQENAWEFDKTPLTLIIPQLEQITCPEIIASLDVLYEYLEAVGVNVQRLEIENNPSEERQQELLTVPQNSKIVFVLSNPTAAKGQVELIRRLAMKNHVMLVSVRAPMEVRNLALKSPILFTYSTEPLMMKALARVLAGELQPKGRLPIIL